MFLLMERGYSFTANAEKEILPVVKEKPCYVSLDCRSQIDCGHGPPSAQTDTPLLLAPNASVARKYGSFPAAEKNVVRHVAEKSLLASLFSTIGFSDKSHAFRSNSVLCRLPVPQILKEVVEGSTCRLYLLQSGLSGGTTMFQGMGRWLHLRRNQDSDTVRALDSRRTFVEECVPLSASQHEEVSSLLSVPKRPVWF